MRDAYKPEIDADYWEVIRRFVIDAVSASVSATAYGDRDLFLATSRLTLWAWQTACLPLDREMIFRRDVIARFIAVGCPEFSAPVRGNFRSQLLRMSEVLLDGYGAPRHLQPLPSANPTAPYSAHDMASLTSWANTQSTAARRINARVLLSLGLGGGLSASEIGELRVCDIDVDDLGVQVGVSGARARTVPILGTWAAALIERREATNPELFVFRENHTRYYPNLISNFVGRSRVLGIRPQTQRMRSTWLVYHLTAGTPVLPLMRAAGVGSLEALTRYLPFVPEVDPSESRTLLSGA